MRTAIRAIGRSVREFYLAYGVARSPVQLRNCPLKLHDPPPCDGTWPCELCLLFAYLARFHRPEPKKRKEWVSRFEKRRTDEH